MDPCVSVLGRRGSKDPVIICKDQELKSRVFLSHFLCEKGHGE